MGSVVIPAILIFTGSPIFFGWAKPVPYNPYNLKNTRWGEALVAVAGSASNLLLAIIFGLIVRYGIPLGLSSPTLVLAGTIAFTNLFLGFFNLIPFPPLDGFTFLRGALPWKWAGDLVRIEERFARMGALSLIFFLFFFSYIFSGPFFNFVVFIFTQLTGSHL
jgi:Zn-dependent protease